MSPKILASARRAPLLAAALLLCVSTTGCFMFMLGAAAGAGAAGVAYVQGDLKATLDGSLAEVREASRSAIEELGLPIAGEAQDPLSFAFKSRTSDDKPVTVKGNRATEKTTDISIRVGPFGDKELSFKILETIKQKLGVG